MAYILIEVDNLSEIKTNEPQHKELEGVIFRDDNGKEKRFKIDGMIPQSVNFMKKKSPDVDWDEGCYHFTVIVGDEI